jgi:hypothetical protein
MENRHKVWLSIVVLIISLFGIKIYLAQNRPLDCKVQTIYLNSMQNLASQKIAKFETKGSISGIQIFIEGKINGQGILSIGYNDSTSYKDYLLKSGKVEIEHESDWYSEACYVKFVPKTKSSGGLEISCNFIGD